MASPAVELFSTSILSNHKVRSRHERFISVLTIKKIAFVYHDLASDDEAKSRWRRKAKDQQLPGLLVNNEWVGGFEDFEEAVEYGELEMFLGVNPAQSQQPVVHPAQLATTSKDVSLYPSLPYAPEGSGRRAEPTADDFISSLGLSDGDVNDADVDELLAGIDTLASQRQQKSQAPLEQKQKYYAPSEQAAIKPLRFAKMGHGSSTSKTPNNIARAPPVARYSDTQRSTKALAAEAAALTSKRQASGSVLREAVSRGKTLDQAMSESNIRNIVGHDDLDDLFASLGLQDVDIDDAEVDDFLAKGDIPQKLRSNEPSYNQHKSPQETAAKVSSSTDSLLKSSPYKNAEMAGTAVLGRSPSTALSASKASLLPGKDVMVSNDNFNDLNSGTSGARSDTTSVTREVDSAVSQPPLVANSGSSSVIEADTSGNVLVASQNSEPTEPVMDTEPNLTDTTTERDEDTNAKPLATTTSRLDTDTEMDLGSNVDLSTADSKADVGETASAQPESAEEVFSNIASTSADLNAVAVHSEGNEQDHTQKDKAFDDVKDSAGSLNAVATNSTAITIPVATAAIDTSPVIVMPEDSDADDLHPLADDAYLAFQYAMGQESVSPISSPSRLDVRPVSSGSPSQVTTLPTAAMSGSPQSTSPRRSPNNTFDRSSPRMSPSARKAIDVSRPNNSDLDAIASQASGTPVRKRRGMSIGGFRLGKDKESKDIIPDTPVLAKTVSTTASPANKAASSDSPKPATNSRHERTISEILRDADAVLGMDDDGENAEGPADTSTRGHADDQEDDFKGIFDSGDTEYSAAARR